jgi:hypothetical protein
MGPLNKKEDVSIFPAVVTLVEERKDLEFNNY